MKELLALGRSLMKKAGFDYLCMLIFIYLPVTQLMDKLFSSLFTLTFLQRDLHSFQSFTYLLDCVPIACLLRKARQDQLLHLRTDFTLESGDFRFHAADKFCFFGALPRGMAMKHFVDNHPIGEDIRLIAVVVVFECLQWHVEWGANI